MGVRLLIPTPLRHYTDGQAEIVLEGETAGEVMDALVARYPRVKRQIYSEEGQLRNFVIIYLNDRDIRHLQRERTPVHDGDVMTIVPSIAGG